LFRGLLLVCGLFEGGWLLLACGFGAGELSSGGPRGDGLLFTDGLLEAGGFLPDGLLADGGLLLTGGLFGGGPLEGDGRATGAGKLLMGLLLAGG
jgi:hypothetical protein